MLGTINHHHHHHGVFPPWQHPLNHIKHVAVSNAISAIVQREQHAFERRPAEAYYSYQPPLEPLKLLLVGDPPNRANMPDKMKQLIKNFKKIEAIYDNYDASTFCPELTTDTDTTQMEKTIRTNASKHTTNTSHSLRTRTRKHKRDGEDIRLLLNQLVTNLPLTTSSDIASETSAFRVVSRSRSRSPARHRSSCSIAVQARLYSTSEDKLTTSAVGTLEGEEWVGGVRALRDSHVRLVQRQLRHIERLNRALDRVTRNCHKDSRQKRVFF